MSPFQVAKSTPADMQVTEQLVKSVTKSHFLTVGKEVPVCFKL